MKRWQPCHLSFRLQQLPRPHLVPLLQFPMGSHGLAAEMPKVWDVQVLRRQGRGEEEEAVVPNQLVVVAQVLVGLMTGSQEWWSWSFGVAAAAFVYLED